MCRIKRIKLAVVVLFVGGVVAGLLTGKAFNRTVHAYSSGPPAGFTNAPGEFDCAECHVPDNAGTGTLTINAPQNYVPGQTYQISVNHTNANDPTRQRWGFQLTALDDSEQRAGTLASADAFTQILDNQGPNNSRQYVEHTSSGTFRGQTGGASWTFNWTAPPEDVGPVVFYAAGNQANGDDNTSGDNVYFTFVNSVPASAAPDYALSVSPASRTVTPGGSATYNVTVVPSGGFTGQITLIAGGLPAGASASFNPAVININDASAQTSTLTVTTTSGVAPGSHPFDINATFGNVSHTVQATLLVVSPSSADLSVTATDSPDPVTINTDLTYNITVTNNGPAAATGVFVGHALSIGVHPVAISSSQGQCSSSIPVTCALGTLAAGASATITLVVQPHSTGQLPLSVQVRANEDDPVPENNRVTIQTLSEPRANAPRLLVPNLLLRTVASGLNNPTSMAFLGTGDLLVLEKDTGKVQRIRSGRAPNTVLDLAVNNASERGLLGIVLHPNFAVNHYVYLFWTESTTASDTNNVNEVPLLGNRVDRYVWNGQTLAHDRQIIRLRALQADAGQPPRGNHNGGVLRFGPDGKLYIIMGDNGRRGLLQNVTSGGTVPDDQFGGPEPDDAHLTGVVLRLNGDGTIPADNPFFNAVTNLTGQAAANVKKIYAYGIRNSFGMDFDPVSGKLWTQENGDDSFDEINRVEAGFNGGWIQLMGQASRVAQYREIETTRAGGLQQLRWSPTLIAATPEEALQRLYVLPGAHYTDPEFSWKYAVAPSPLGFLRGRALGAQFEGDMFVGASRTTLLGGFLFRFDLTPDRQHLAFNDTRLQDRVADNADKFDLAESESLLVGRDFGITTDIQTGPDGHLYVVSLSNGAVYEISARPLLFVARLDGAQETPPNTSPAKGTGTVLLDIDETTARVSLNFDGLTSAQTDAHIHGPAAPGTAAPPVFSLPAGSFEDFQITLTPAQVRDLKAGLFYINVHSANFPAGEIRGQLAPAPSSAVFELSAAAYSVAENARSVSVTVKRLGDTSTPASVDYATSNITASDRGDYTTARGTLRFAAGERSQTVDVFITDDVFLEGDETLSFTLSNPNGLATLGTPATATITINANDNASPASNPIDDAAFFVRQHYIDFLNREPDAEGLAFWTNQITECETRPLAERQACREVRRINVSAAFFLSVEFQQTGFLVYRFHQAAFLIRPPNGAHPLLRFADFLADTQEISRGVVVNAPGWQERLEANKRAYAENFVQRPAFLQRFPLTMSPATFIQTLNSNIGVLLTAAEYESLVNRLTTGEITRAQALREVAENEQLARGQELRNAFVLMQYFGYLRRNPDDPPDNTFDGYGFWLNKLNEFGGDYVRAEMVKAFITSGEYRARFGP
jgi:uncharacterized repeat protein (TIGR01451 family)